MKKGRITAFLLSAALAVVPITASADDLSPASGTQIITQDSPEQTVSMAVTYIAEALGIQDAGITLSQESFVYSGKENEPKLTVTLTVDGEEVTLTEGEDFTAEYKDNTHAGTASVEITGIGYYGGTVTKEFTITPQEITVNVNDAESTSGKELAELTYTIEGEIAEGDDLGITLTTKADPAQPGKYEIVAEFADNPDYQVTVNAGTYTVAAAPASETELPSSSTSEPETTTTTTTTSAKPETSTTTTTTSAKPETTTTTTTTSAKPETTTTTTTTSAKPETSTTTTTTSAKPETTTTTSATAVTTTTAAETTTTAETTAPVQTFTEEMVQGETFVLPYANGYVYDVADDSILSVNEFGEVTALKPGTTTVTVTTPDGEVLTYTITVEEKLVRGDVDLNGLVNAIDAAQMLIYSAAKGAGEPIPMYSGDSADEKLEARALLQGDTDEDGVINAIDAANDLLYAAIVGAGDTPNWLEILGWDDWKSYEY